MMKVRATLMIEMAKGNRIEKSNKKFTFLTPNQVRGKIYTFNSKNEHTHILAYIEIKRNL